MFLKLKVALALCLSGLSAASFANLGKSCSYVRTSYFYKSSVDITESVLDCLEGNRNYSVFLVSKEGLDFSSSNHGEHLSFQVVDNNAGGEIKWGPGIDSSKAWTNWGIEVYKGEISGPKQTKMTIYNAGIRVPVKGRIYNQRDTSTTVKIPCQKNNLQLKRDISSTCSNGGGRILRSPNMKFSVSSDGIKITRNFDFKDHFRPKQVWCTS